MGTGTAAPIRTVLIAGGGIVGWSAAAMLRRRIPALAVTIVPLPPPADALADRVQSALPSIVNFHDDLGLTDADTVARAGSGFRLGTLFEGWSRRLPPYVHAYGEHGRPFGTASFHQHWIRAALAGEAAPFDAFAPAAALARAGRFAPQAGEPGAPGSPLAGIAYGLTLTPARYHHLLRAFALHLGAVEREGALARVRVGADGAIEALEMADGAALAADLFVDATGPRALLRSALGLRLESWRRWLPCDRIEIEEAAATEPAILDTVAAAEDGWRWRSASPLLASRGRVFRAAGAGGGVPLEQGRISQPWRANCVAIGDAAVRVEPLEWTNLHLALSAVDRIVAMMPDTGFNPLELWDYDRQTAAEADRVRDFLALHYLASDRPEPFWRDAAAAEPPPSLAHTLSLFRERGRLPFYEEETFARDSWLAVLLGQGVMPRAADPLIDAVPPAQSAAAMAAMRSGIEALVPGVPTHAAALQMLMRQTAR
jgi:tryptophan halogenase